MSAKVCILNYGSGNVGSVLNLFSSITPDVIVSNDKDAIRQARHVVLPGVGAFASSMAKMRSRIPLDVLYEEVVEKGKPFLGICVGMQVLAETGHEFGIHEGLGWIPGEVDRLESGSLPLPHIGWNDIENDGSCRLLRNFESRTDFYFVHSYVFRARDVSHVVSTAEYGERFAAIVSKGNIHGVQFHPEKSQKAGRILLENFLTSS